MVVNAYRRISVSVKEAITEHGVNTVSTKVSMQYLNTYDVSSE